jgi:arginine-tRNA-protein transferase
MTSIPLLISSPHPCSYLDDELAQSAFVNPIFELSTDIYSQLLARGFRRSGDHVYRPQCAFCQECVAVRVAVQDFKPNRKQKRCLQANVNTIAIVKPPMFEGSHYNMYMRYQRQRHADGSMANSTPEDYMDFLGSSWCQTRFVEFSIANELAAVAIVDYLNDSLSAVYTFFDPKFSNYSLGTYAVLWQVQQAKQLGLSYVYLGFWIKNCQKMAYKNQYQPLQGLINQQWQFLEAEK